MSHVCVDVRLFSTVSNLLCFYAVYVSASLVTVTVVATSKYSTVDISYTVALPTLNVIGTLSDTPLVFAAVTSGLSSIGLSNFEVLDATISADIIQRVSYADIPASKSTSDVNVGAIAGAVAGGVMLIAVTALAVRHNRKQKPKSDVMPIANQKPDLQGDDMELIQSQFKHEPPPIV